MCFSFEIISVLEIFSIYQTTSNNFIYALSGLPLCVALPEVFKRSLFPAMFSIYQHSPHTAPCSVPEIGPSWLLKGSLLPSFFFMCVYCLRHS